MARIKSPILAAQNVTKTFTTGKDQELVAVDNLSFEINEGEFICLLGASGCGKSTILNMFAGFTQPTAGEVLLRDKPIMDIEPRCGMIFQSYALFPWKTVRGNVEFGLKIKGLSGAERRERAAAFIEMVNLRGFTIIRRNCPVACSSASRSRGSSRPILKSS